MTFEFKTRYDYVRHPETGEFEKQEYNEKTEIEFPDYDSAVQYRFEFEQIWQDYLRKK